MHRTFCRNDIRKKKKNCARKRDSDRRKTGVLPGTALSFVHDKQDVPKVSARCVRRMQSLFRMDRHSSPAVESGRVAHLMAVHEEAMPEVILFSSDVGAPRACIALTVAESVPVAFLSRRALRCRRKRFRSRYSVCTLFPATTREMCCDTRRIDCAGEHCASPCAYGRRQELSICQGRGRQVGMGWSPGRVR